VGTKVIEQHTDQGIYLALVSEDIAEKGKVGARETPDGWEVGLARGAGWYRVEFLPGHQKCPEHRDQLVAG
jgi:hypothetical protein